MGIFFMQMFLKYVFIAKAIYNYETSKTEIISKLNSAQIK